MGVVRQAVNRSAGREGCMGKTSFGPQAANWMQFSSRPTQLVTAVLCGGRAITQQKVDIESTHLYEKLTVPLSSKCFKRLENDAYTRE